MSARGIAWCWTAAAIAQLVLSVLVAARLQRPMTSLSDAALAFFSAGAGLSWARART